MINQTHLRTFQAVLEIGSFSGAAKELGYTTSAVSQQIAALERAAGARLFERGPRGIWPTPAALWLGGQAAEILFLLNEVEHGMRAFGDGRRGRLRIGVAPSVGVRLLPHTLSRLAVTRAGADLTVREEDDPVASVSAAKIDLALLPEYDLLPRTWPDELCAAPILDEELVIIRGEPHETAAPRSALGAFAQEVWIGNRPGSPAYDNLLRVCAQAGFQPEVRFFSDDHDVVRGMVGAGLGVALVPPLAITEDGAATVYRLADVVPHRRVLALRRSSDPNPLLPIVIDTLRESARPLERRMTPLVRVLTEGAVSPAAAVPVPARRGRSRLG